MPFEQLVKQILEAPGPRETTYIDLLRKITNSKYPTDEESERILGSKIWNALQVISETYELPDTNIYELLNKPNDANFSQMKTWLRKNELCVIGMELQIKILENWITSRAREIPEDIIKKFEEKVASLHDWSLTEIQGDHCHRLWSDGEINSTKSGDIYGLRNVFVDESEVLGCPKFKFPVESGRYSYAVLPLETAQELRKEILEMIS
jgi:hypothetical protein